MKHLGLFEGIGGFSLAARWMGWETVAWCEWNEFGQKVLRHHFPEAEGHGDITKTDFTKYANRIDILTGGFPCQPYSTAGKRLGTDDDRHLWPEMLRAIREISPRYVLGENVRGLTNWNGGLVFDQVQADLETEGYEVLPFLLPACGVNAPHRRDRIWFIAHRNDARLQEARAEQQAAGTEQYGELGRTTTDTGGQQLQERTPERNKPNTEEERTRVDNRFKRSSNTRNATDTGDTGLQRIEIVGSTTKGRKIKNKFTTRLLQSAWENFPTQPPVCSRNDGLSGRLDGITFSKWRQESIKAYGNAIVPQVALQIFKAIEQYENDNA